MSLPVSEAMILSPPPNNSPELLAEAEHCSVLGLAPGDGSYEVAMSVLVSQHPLSSFLIFISNTVRSSGLRKIEGQPWTSKRNHLERGDRCKSVIPIRCGNLSERTLPKC